MRYAKEIISAIEYMHMCNTVHRDIKPENVCLSAEDTCRLIDFGHAAFSQVQYLK
jgi:serine/threonine protein kinase